MVELVKELNSPDEADRIYAAQDIAETENSDLAGPLMERLSVEESQAVRDAIVFALKSIPCSGIYDMLLELFRSPDPYLRNAVIGIFGAEGDHAIPFLESCMNDADGEVRKLILDALFSTGVPDAVRAIRQALNDPAVNVRITAVEYLGRMEDRESTDKIIRLLGTETEPMLKIAILESLSLIATRAEIINIFSILAPDGDFTRADPLCLSQMITLSAKTGSPDIICKVIDAVTDIEMYGEDIVHAIGGAEREFKGICRESRIIERIKKIMEKTKDDELYALCGELIHQ